ncbi:MAG: hypothetical protein PWP20_1427 [Eubacteriaceae bacterium]|nr:hypothetical protein [Eubacteriaceae bacterium]
MKQMKRTNQKIKNDINKRLVSLKYPSPLGPKPAPGVPTICTSLSSLSKNDHESSPVGVLSQI